MVIIHSLIEHNRYSEMGMWGYYPEQSDGVCDEFSSILYDLGIDFDPSNDERSYTFTPEQTELINDKLKELYNDTPEADSEFDLCKCTYLGVVRRLSQEGLVIRDDIWETAIECIDHYVQHLPPETEEDHKIIAEMRTEMLEKNIKTPFIGLNTVLNM